MNKNKRLIPYIGYGRPNTIVVMGSVLFGKNVKASKPEDSKWNNSKKMLKLFFSKPSVNEEVTIIFNDQTKLITTDGNGYFKTTLQFDKPVDAGWHTINYYLNKNKPNQILVENKCIILDSATTFGVISDIDDTIVVSHANRFRKKIWTALSKNANTRKTKGTILKLYGKLRSEKKAFFYVSSSERNLYEFWNHFFKANGFPLGPLLLKELKYGITDFMFSGKGTHRHKYDKISDLLDFYPFLSFILVGDNGQKDVQIYHRIAMDFPGRINSVYIVKAVHKSLDKTIMTDFKRLNVNLHII